MNAFASFSNPWGEMFARQVHPQTLIYYAPLVARVQDIKGRTISRLAGSDVFTSHPRVCG